MTPHLSQKASFTPLDKISPETETNTETENNNYYLVYKNVID
ncbi:MAG: hypothetical protein OFPI_29460 [Osedax symbiont Rs2]|nr:MAG: hypothetical protein OFPI_29460 [Osedax symbiont Rs2]